MPFATDGLDLYLDDIGREPLLSRDEEAAHARRYRSTGDAEALEALVKGNLRFVVSVAKAYRGRGLPLEDLINEGNLGLLEAARRFDESRGVRFVTYAAWWIRQAILAALARVRAPATPAPTSGRPRSAPDASKSAAGASGTARWISIDAPVSKDGETSLAELIEDQDEEGPDAPLERRALRDALEATLALLPPREEKVLRLYYGMDDGRARTVSEIADELEVAPVRVRKARTRGLARLRGGGRKRFLGSFVG